MGFLFTASLVIAVIELLWFCASHFSCCLYSPFLLFVPQPDWTELCCDAACQHSLTGKSIASAVPVRFKTDNNFYRWPTDGNSSSSPSGLPKQNKYLFCLIYSNLDYRHDNTVLVLPSHSYRPSCHSQIRQDQQISFEGNPYSEFACGAYCYHNTGISNFDTLVPWKKKKSICDTVLYTTGWGHTILNL